MVMTPKAKKELHKILKYAGMYSPEKTTKLLEGFRRRFKSATADEIVKIAQEEYGLDISHRARSV